MNYKAIGWTRYGFGRGDVKTYHLRSYVNAITSFCGGVLGRIQPPACITPLRIYSWNMTYKNQNLEALIIAGWRPTVHGEFLDLYNKRSMGGIVHHPYWHQQPKHALYSN